MPTFQSKKFRSTGEASAMGAKYRAVMSRHPFLMFGLPFLAVIVAGSFVLTPATAIRYERHDRRVRQMTRDEELNVRRSARKVDMREEYYVRGGRQQADSEIFEANHLRTEVGRRQRLGQLGAEARGTTSGRERRHLTMKTPQYFGYFTFFD
ncbi:Cytochrome oxidase assembly [Beauveria asiatica]|uniref:Cytochrome c oxidase assembly protein COX16, mitochondrial n=1 Tax=Beauveria asiatica TaxID=1069075 RepID=A0AAW0RTU9_9HYPO